MAGSHSNTCEKPNESLDSVTEKDPSHPTYFADSAFKKTGKKKKKKNCHTLPCPKDTVALNQG